MAGVENQYHFGQASPDFANPPESIDSVTRAAFQKVQKLWLKYVPLIPQDYDLKNDKGCDINFPGGNIYLFERTIPVSPSLRVGDVNSSWEDWVAPEAKVVGLQVQIQDWQNRNDYSFYFSKTDQLIGFDSFQKQPAEKDYDRKKSYADKNELPMLSAKASFRGNKLYSIFYEVPNGTLFPDPRGEIDSIWPQWTKKGMDLIDGIDRVEYLKKDGHPATEKDWELYLARIKERKLVLNPRTHNYVHQTEKQAAANLKRSRIWIYYHTPQRFHFYRTSVEPGFVSEMGYSIRSKFGGNFIPKKTTGEGSYHVVSESQTIKLLSSWNPEPQNRF